MPFSMAPMVCRVTPTRSASSSWVKSLAARAARNLRFFAKHTPPVKLNISVIMLSIVYIQRHKKTSAQRIEYWLFLTQCNQRLQGVSSAFVDDTTTGINGDHLTIGDRIHCAGCADNNWDTHSDTNNSSVASQTTIFDN